MKPQHPRVFRIERSAILRGRGFLVLSDIAALLLAAPALLPSGACRCARALDGPVCRAGGDRHRAGLNVSVSLGDLIFALASWRERLWLAF